jgi:hypothetical protein
VRKVLYIFVFVTSLAVLLIIIAGMIILNKICTLRKIKKTARKER